MWRKSSPLYCKDGGWFLRDALSLLDQCVAFYIGERLTYDHVLEVLGAVDTDVLGKLLDRLLDGDVKKVIETVDELVMQGRELSQLASVYLVSEKSVVVKSSDNMEECMV